MGLVSIGEFSQLSRLSPKALRLYDELGLLVPDHVDAATGYRWYADTQLDQARVVALLRRAPAPAPAPAHGAPARHLRSSGA